MRVIGLYFGILLLLISCGQEHTSSDGPEQSQPISTTNQKYLGIEQTMPIPQIIQKIAINNIPGSYKARRDLFITDTNGAQGENRKLPAHEKNPRTLRVATYNVHFWTNPKEEPQGYSKDSIDPILAAIKNINADILLLQEASWGNNQVNGNWLSNKVRNKSFAQLKNFLSDMGYLVNDAAFYQAAIHQASPFGNLILSKYPIASSGKGQIQFSKQAGSTPNENRGLASLRVSLPAGKDLLLINTHLDVDSSVASNADMRVEQLNEILNYIPKSTNNVIIAGDMNQERKQEMSYKVNNKDAWQLFAAHQTVKPEWGTLDILTNNGFKDSFSKMSWQPPKYTTWNGSAIDYIFIKDTFEFKVLGSFAYFDPASDHLPLIVDLQL